MNPPIDTGKLALDWWLESASTQLESLRQTFRLGRSGLRFVNPQTERDYRVWHAQIAVPYIRIGMIGSLVAWSLTLGALSLTPQRLAAALPWLAFAMYPTLIFCLVCAYLPKLRRWMLPSSAFANALAGALGVLIFYTSPAMPEMSMVAVIVITYFACTIFRFHVTVAAPIVFANLALNQALLLDTVARGELSAVTAALYTVGPVIAFLTGLMVCGVLDHLTRQSYQQERLIAAQTEALDTERQRANGLLYSIFPTYIAERLKTQPGIIAEQFEEATIVFVDLVGFTPLATGLTPQQTVTLLSQIFESFDEVAARHGVEKIKTIGDGYMAVAGVPDRNPRHAEAAVRFALDLREALAQFSARADLRLEMRTGLHSGTVIAGVIGRQKLAYDVWGDAVNTAARMESHGLPSEIQITDATKQRLNEQYSLRERGTIEIKGKGAMRVWLLDGAAAINEAGVESSAVS